MMIKTTLVFAIAFALAAEKKPVKPVKFSADQCRVLNQMKINTGGMCPPKPVNKR